MSINLSQKKLNYFAELCAKKISEAKIDIEYFIEPFKHVVIDNFFATEIADGCLKNFPEVDDIGWDFQCDEEIEVKYRSTWKSEFDIPDGIIDAVRIFNSAIFLKALSNKFDVPKLIPDPYFTGGGLNVTKPGGLLDVHIDGNYHDAMDLHRRLNVILYLNPEWQEDWGGEFGLYDSKGENCLKKIPPLFNRVVIFETHDFSFHGLPEALNFPAGNSRKSVILYYYTKSERPPEKVSVKEPHSALWVKLDVNDKKRNKTRKHN